jgi:hypothetical protein
VSLKPGKISLVVNERYRRNTIGTQDTFYDIAKTAFSVLWQQGIVGMYPVGNRISTTRSIYFVYYLLDGKI